MITDGDMLDQVRTTIDGDPDYDAVGIRDHIHREHGLIDIDDIPSDDYWAIVDKHRVDRA
jgi:hypothetical protein